MSENLLDLQEVWDETTPITLQFQGKPVRLDVKLAAINSKFFDSVIGEEKIGYKLIEKAVSSWNIALKGEVLPVTVESISLLPFSLIQLISDAITPEQIKKQ
jgi:hypothetical protein